MLHQAVLTIDGIAPTFLGYYLKGADWNGWEYAYFELDEAMKVAEGFNQQAEHPMTYDPIYDQFYMWDEGEDDYYMVKGIDAPTDKGTKHLYSIGAGCWTWDRMSKSSIRSIAQETEEFIFYHDTYNYMDECDIRREQTVEAIIEQFKDLKVLVQAMNIMRDEDLEADARFELLGGILVL